MFGRKRRRTNNGGSVDTTNHLVHDQVVQSNGVRYAMRAGDTRLGLRVNFINIGPDSLPPGGFMQDDVFFDIRVTGAGVHTVDEMVLQMDVRNQSVNPVIPLLSPWFFNRYEVQANGSFTDDTIYPQQMYLRHCHAHMPASIKATCSEWIGMEASTSFSRSDPRTTWNCYDEDGVPIPAGGSRKYFIPLYNFLSTTSLFLPCKRQDPRLRFYLHRNPIRSDNDPADLAGTPLRLEGALLIMKGVVYENEVLIALNDHYKKVNTVMPTIVHERQVVDIKNAAPGVEIPDQPLTSLNGDYVGFFLTLVRGNASREQLYSSNNTWTAISQGWLPINTVSLKDSSGNPIGFNQIPDGFLRGTATGHAFPECFMSALKNVTFFPFAKDLMASLVNGLPSGGMVFDSNFTISITPGTFTPDPATQNYQLWIFGLRKAQFTMDTDGLFTVIKQ